MWRLAQRSFARQTAKQTYTNTRTISALQSNTSRHSSAPALALQPHAHSRPLVAQRRVMSSSSSSNSSGNGDSVPSHSNALALAPATASDSSSIADADGASAFVEADAESAAPKRPVVYRPFVATHEWQVIEHDHILPPGTRTHSGHQFDSKHAEHSRSLALRGTRSRSHFRSRMRVVTCLPLLCRSVDQV